MFKVSGRTSQRGSGSRAERAKLMISKYQVTPQVRKRRMWISIFSFLLLPLVLSEPELQKYRKKDKSTHSALQKLVRM